MEKAVLQEFLAQGLSLEKIGKQVGLHPTTVAYWLRKHDLKAVNSDKNAPKGLRIPRDVLEAWVERGWTTQEMADELEVGSHTVRHWLKRYELSTARAHANVARRKAMPRPAEVTRRCHRHGPTTFLLDTRGYYSCKRCRSENVSNRRRKVKQILAEEAGGSCALCGYDRYVGALHFHHLDPQTKGVSAFARRIDAGYREAAD